MPLKPHDASSSAVPDRKLIGLLKAARNAQRLVEECRDCSVEKLARQLDCRPAHFTRLVRLNYLAPDIITAIFDGTQPAALTRDTLLKANLPTDWALQRKLFGFAKLERPLPPRQLFGRGMWPAKNQPSAR